MLHTSILIKKQFQYRRVKKIACISEDELKIFKEYCRVKGVENNFLNYIIWKDSIALNKLKAKHFVKNNGEQ